MVNLPLLRDSLRIVLLSHDVMLCAGLQAVLGPGLRVPPADAGEQAVLDGAGGMLLLAPGGADTAQRIRMLRLAHRLRRHDGWRALVLVDETNGDDLRLARLTGLPVLGLHLSVPVLRGRILAVMKSRRELRPDSVAGLTGYQWSAIHTSLHGRGGRGERRSATFYSHRLAGLQRLRVQHMHELRRIVTGCGY